MTRKFKAGDKIALSNLPHPYVDISPHIGYTLYQNINGNLAFIDDVGDERVFTTRDGRLCDWMEPCEIKLVNDVEKPVMIDAEELLEQIDGGTRYNMTVEEVIAYLRGFIRANKGGK